MKKMRELPPSEFQWSRYDGGTIPISVVMNTKTAVDWLAEQNIIGFIPGMKLEVRPTDIAVGILIDFDGFATWAHLDECIFKEYQDKAS